MLLIEKFIKLLDDRHFEVFREHVKNLSIRSYYPLALIDVIDRDYKTEAETSRLYREVYGDLPAGENDKKKFFQLAHYTFRLSGYLAKNYPDYLSHNISRIQVLINQGERENAIALMNLTREVAEKTEDFDTEIKVLSILAQTESLLESDNESVKIYERIDQLLDLKKQLNKISLFAKQQLKTKGKEDKNFDLEGKLTELKEYAKSPGFCVQILARLNICYLLYLRRDPRFYLPETYKALTKIEEDLEKQQYIIFPFLHNVAPKMLYLKLSYSIKASEPEEVMREAEAIMDYSENELFWNSFINLPAINSIAIQSSYLVSSKFTTYREDHSEKMSPDLKQKIEVLIVQCEKILKNELLEEKFIQRYVSMTGIYAGLLLLTDKQGAEKSIETLENLLIFFQQVPFHTKLDNIYWVLIMAAFALQDFEKTESYYRRYKKSIRGKSVNSNNDTLIHCFYFASKYLDTKRGQYAKKMQTLLDEVRDQPNMKLTIKTFKEITDYFEIPVS